MVDYRKTFHTYVFFAARLLAFAVSWRGCGPFEPMGGGKALGDAFSHYTVRLMCFIHCRQNIKSELQVLGYYECAINKVLDDIFGCQHGNTFSERLVDSSNEEEFS